MKTKNKTDNEKPGPEKKMPPIPKHALKEPPRPPSISPRSNNNSRPPGRVITNGTETGHITAHTEHGTINNRPAYCWPPVQLLMNDAGIRERMHVNWIFRRRDPNDPNTFWVVNPGGQREYYWHIVVRTLRNPTNNTVLNRETWGNNLATFYNRVAQRSYRYGMTYIYAGDATPVNEPQYLGDLLTTEDTMRIIIDAHQDLNQHDILHAEENTNILSTYYGPHRVDQVRNFFNPPPPPFIRGRDDLDDNEADDLFQDLHDIEDNNI